MDLGEAVLIAAAVAVMLVLLAICGRAVRRRSDRRRAAREPRPWPEDWHDR